MSVRTDFEEKFGVAPYTIDQLGDVLASAEDVVARATEETPETGDARLVLYLFDRIDELGRMPTKFRCMHCFRFATRGMDAEDAEVHWVRGPGTMSMDEVIEHVKVCNYNPTVRALWGADGKLKKLRALVVDNVVNNEAVPASVRDKFKALVDEMAREKEMAK